MSAENPPTVCGVMAACMSPRTADKFQAKQLHDSDIGDFSDERGDDMAVFAQDPVLRRKKESEEAYEEAESVRVAV
eukprot:CAMPEP_0171454946 /NCGR_PEP_ID=MMETSP0945-20130129/2036_1 /TAXON_ID=109269 /ORGANISM="Vaucheria litorea, Strain CCMP2940" /LENGTH=75 /DNA_ID=CAMNT_0011980085 /DNA_START=92 /DNA_END=320 /DNA_ORIENTATION=+